MADATGRVKELIGLRFGNGTDIRLTEWVRSSAVRWETLPERCQAVRNEERTPAWERSWFRT